jgi:hypothetical protein
MTGLIKIGVMAIGMGALAHGLDLWSQKEKSQKKKIEPQPKLFVEPPKPQPKLSVEPPQPFAPTPDIIAIPTSDIIAIPKADATPIVWEKFLEATTDARRGVDPKDAQIIFLGDCHLAKWQPKWRGVLIDHYGSNNTIVLCECTQAGSKVKNIARSFISQKEVLSYGWDNVASSTFAIKYVIAPMNQLREKYKENAPSSKWSQDDLAIWKTLLVKFDLFADSIRTLELIKTAETFIRRGSKIPDQKIFVIAGSKHLLKDKGCILDSFKHLKATLLIPKAPLLTEAAEAEYSRQLVKEMA